MPGHCPSGSKKLRTFLIARSIQLICCSCCCYWDPFKNFAWNWKLPKLKVGQIESCQNWSCQNWKLHEALMTAFYCCSVNYQSEIGSTTFSNLTCIYNFDMMCPMTWWSFRVIRQEKSAIRPFWAAQFTEQVVIETPWTGMNYFQYFWP